jgi:hypothetical protein
MEATTFHAMLLEDMENVFLNTDEWGETVSYTVSSGSPKTIVANVERAPVKPSEPASRAYGTRNTHIWISRDATVGIATVKERLDKVALLAKLSDTVATTYIVKKVLGQDPGGWHLELEA